MQNSELFDIQIKNIKNYFRVYNTVGLADILGVKAGTITTWKGRGQIPNKNLHKLEAENSLPFGYFNLSSNIDNNAQKTYGIKSNVAFVNNGHQVQNNNKNENTRIVNNIEEEPSYKDLELEIGGLLKYAPHRFLMEIKEKLLKIKEITDS